MLLLEWVHIATVGHSQDISEWTGRKMDLVEQFCLLNYEQRALNQEEVMKREEICKNIGNYLRHIANRKTELEIYGSTLNGFGFKGSDVDISMTIGEKDSTNVNEVEMIQHVARVLGYLRWMKSSMSCTKSVIRLVKFEHVSGLDGDITMYNIMGLRNTKLLRAYCDIDKRCQLLGFAMKALVKCCWIGNAARGTLSSYAYILMVIHYLQQCDPPVLPVLQEIEKSYYNVDGWNVYYFEDMERLPQCWEANQNKQSAADLWIGLLRFYSSEFDFADRVVSISQKAVMTVADKGWTERSICIEDPFVLDHNLGDRVRSHNADRIFGVLKRAYDHFSTEPKSEIAPEDILDYYLDKSLLTGEEEPREDRRWEIRATR